MSVASLLLFLAASFREQLRLVVYLLLKLIDRHLLPELLSVKLNRFCELVFFNERAVSVDKLLQLVLQVLLIGVDVIFERDKNLLKCSPQLEAFVSWL